ncbi:MAG: aldo/keto reductase [Anaerolineae bacterium]|nr:aldo/keto reductase [Anaerolineae bacterium]
MQYRTFGTLDWKPSALGFGAMRLPTLNDDPAQIDEPEATRMIRHAIDHGVNYIDTAYPYHNEASEPFVGRVLQDGYREKVKLATKMPAWLVKEWNDFDRYLDEQLERLQTDHVDFYLLHGLGAARWDKLQELKVLDWAEGALADGRIKYLGFSFHDHLDAFKSIVDAYAWTFCQIQLNYMDIEYQAGVEGLKYAAGKGLAVVVMEPLRGGRLAKEPPESVARLWAQAETQHSPTDWALQWVWHHPEVSLLLSGMSTMQHVEENLASAGRSAPNSLSATELALIDQVRQAYEALAPIPCTQCRYCMPCPNGVNIPRILDIYNKAVMYGDVHGARVSYTFVDEAERADHCVACGECEAACPQHIEIITWLEKAHEILAK